MKIKKILFYSMLFGCLPFCVNAQMIDLVGSMAVGGAMDTEAVKSVGTMNRQLKKTQLISDIQMKVVDIMTTYGGYYKRMRPSEIVSRGIKVHFDQAEKGDAFQATVNNPDTQTCQTLLTTRWEGASYLNVVFGGQTKKLNLSEASSSATTICLKAKAISIIYQ